MSQEAEALVFKSGERKGRSWQVGILVADCNEWNERSLSGKERLPTGGKEDEDEEVRTACVCMNQSRKE
jgi:hypothetical protein